MKTFVVALALVALGAVSVSAGVVPSGTYDGPVYELTPIEEPGQQESSEESSEESSNALEPHVRERRLTCDFFSFSSQWVTPNHSACAAKCMAKRRRGGTCRNGKCVCRKDRW